MVMADFSLAGEEHRHAFAVLFLEQGIAIYVHYPQNKRRRDLDLPQGLDHVVTKMTVIAGEYRQQRRYYFSPALIAT